MCNLSTWGPGNLRVFSSMLVSIPQIHTFIDTSLMWSKNYQTFQFESTSRRGTCKTGFEHSQKDKSTCDNEAH